MSRGSGWVFFVRDLLRIFSPFDHSLPTIPKSPSSAECSLSDMIRCSASPPHPRLLHPQRERRCIVVLDQLLMCPSFTNIVTARSRRIDPRDVAVFLLIGATGMTRMAAWPPAVAMGSSNFADLPAPVPMSASTASPNELRLSRAMQKVDTYPPDGVLGSQPFAGGRRGLHPPSSSR